MAATVVLAEARDVVAVPLGAVLSGGDGRPAVQVRAADGAITVTPITTGVIEGAFIEVKSGLSGGETVLLEVRR